MRVSITPNIGGIIYKLEDHLTEGQHGKSVRIYGSLLIPSREFISRFKFRPWKGVYISNKYLNSLDDFYAFTHDLIEIYLDNNIYPIIETESSSIEKLNYIHTLFKT